MIIGSTDKIYTEKYIPGSYRRKELKGHYDFFRYNYDDVKVDAAKGKFNITDELVDLLFEEGVINLGEYRGYQQLLKNYFRDFQVLKEMSDEEIYGDISHLRQEYFNKKVFEFLKRRREKRLIEAYQRSRQIKNPLDIFKEIIYHDVKQEKRYIKSPIDRLEKLQLEIENSHKDLVFIPGHYGQLPFLIKLLTDYIYHCMERDILAEERRIYILLKKEAIAEEPTYVDWRFLLENNSSERMQYLLNNEKIKVMLYNNKCTGLDLTKLSGSLKGFMAQAVQGNYLFIGLGEKMLFSLHGANFGYYLLSAIKSVRAQRYTNLYHKSSGRVPYIVGFVPAGILPATHFTGVEFKGKSFYHFNLFFDKKKDKADNGLQEVSPELYLNYYSTTFDPEDFPEFEMTGKNNEFFAFNQQRQNIFKSIIEKDGLLQYHTGYYDLENSFRIDSEERFKRVEKGVLFNGILVDDISKLSLVPYLAHGYNDGIVSPRELVEEKRVPSGAFIYSNFLYFVTDNIIYTYNRLRNRRKMEQIDIKNIYLGYQLIKGENGRRYENFPLYNKGFVASTKEGEILFGNRTLTGGRIIINDLQLEWGKEQVNTRNNNYDFIIYTPFIENETLSRRKIDYLNFKYQVGKGRLNLVLVDNQIVAVRQGEVLLPSIGVVLSFAGSLAEKVKKALVLREIEDGYYLPGEYKLKVHLDKPENMPEDIWNKIDWAYGGGTILVQDGVNLVADHEKQVKYFREEGWFHPLSKQTQETQVQDWVRGPRTVIGRTIQKEFFIAVFSGRTSISQGANFAEVVSILEKEMGSLEWVMNLDGGASSCLGLIYKGEFFELSYPAVSRTTSAGMVRPVNSMIFLTKSN